MIKKFVSVVGAAAMMAFFAAPAGAFTYNSANVSSYSNSQANTGANTQQNYASSAFLGSAEVERSSNLMSTSGATSYAGGLVVANTNVGNTFAINNADVSNSVQSGAFTGENRQYNQAIANMGCHFGCSDVAEVEHSSNWMSTGNARSGATGLSVANTNVGYGRFSVNTARVSTSVTSTANTGMNSQVNSATANFGGTEVHGSSNTMYTGAANSSTHAWTVVNTNWSL